MSVSTKLVSAGVAVVAFGAGTLAVVPSQASDDPSSSSASSAKKHHPRKAFVRHVQYADFVTRNGVRHEVIRGTVKTLSAHSITVRAKNGHTERFTVNSATVTRILGDGHKGKDDFADVNVGDRAFVAGRGKHVAKHVVVRTPKKAAQTS